MEELTDNAVSSSRLLSAVHWLLSAALVATAVFFAYAMLQCLRSVERYGFPATMDVDFLTGCIALAGAILLLGGMIGRLRSGEPLFTLENARVFRLMALVVMVKVVVSVLVQAIISGANPAFRMDIVFSADMLLVVLVLYLLYAIFKHGSSLQAEVQDMV